jgi:hypothetical protein
MTSNHIDSLSGVYCWKHLHSMGFYTNAEEDRIERWLQENGHRPLWPKNEGKDWQ